MIIRVVSLLLLGLLCRSLDAQKLYLYPKATTAPQGSYQSVTATVTGVNDKSVTWSSSGGKLVGQNPCLANEPCTIALFSAEPGKISLRATSNADHSTVASAEVVFTAAPSPVTTHPRLLITAEILPQLRAKATAKNVVYQSMRERAVAAMQQDREIWNWSCSGGSGQARSDQSQNWKEQDAYLFAFMSEIAPTKQERDQWGCVGRDVFMTMAGYVAHGALDLSKGNRWSDSVLPFSLTADWLMGGGYLTPADLTVVRQYLAKLEFEQINDSYNGTIAVIGKYNSPAEFDPSDETSTTVVRSMGNNYTHARVLMLTAAALTLNDTPADDPPLTNTCNATRYQVCPDGTAGSLHAYWRYVAGGMLYKDWAEMEDPDVVQQAYQEAYKNLPAQPRCNTLWHKRIACLGGGRGGESVEGTSYGGSLAALRRALNVMHTAGYDDPALYGPQISMGTMSFWDLHYVADLQLLVGMSGEAKNRSRWTSLTDGDTYTYYTYPANFGAESATLSYDALTGRTDRASALEWTVMNTAFGMAAGKEGNCNQHCGYIDQIGNDLGSATALDAFLASPDANPVTSNPPADPRPSLPTDWYDAGNQHILTRDKGWATDEDTIFSYYCTNTQIDHEHQFCGGFDLYSQGEFITKGRTEFNDYNDEMSTAKNKNSLMLLQYPGQTWCTADPWCTYNQVATEGGQFWHGYQAGLATLYHAELPAYVAAIVDMTNAYNGGSGDYKKFNGVTAASRSLVYLRGSSQVIYYDRGATGSNAWDKATYLVTTGTPSFSGNTASWLTRSGKQKVYWTAVEGKSPQLETAYTDADAANDWEIYGRIKNDAGNVPSARFLSVLQWGPATASAAASSLVKSSEGTAFEGALTGSSLVMFMRDWPATFTTVTYPASGATTQYLSDLAPNTTYTISAAGAPATASTDTAGVLTFASSGAGTVSVTAPVQHKLASEPVTRPPNRPGRAAHQ